MKSFAVCSVVLCLAAGALECRAEDTNAAPQIIGAGQAADYIGKRLTVTGVVAQVTFRPSLVFLNFDKPYPASKFTAVIRNRHTNEFENLPGLKGKAVAVKGEVKDYNGRPEMELTGKSQLKVLGEAK